MTSGRQDALLVPLRTGDALSRDAGEGGGEGARSAGALVQPRRHAARIPHPNPLPQAGEEARRGSSRRAAVLTLMALGEPELHELIESPPDFARHRALTLEVGGCAPAYVYQRALLNRQAAPDWADLLGTRLYIVDGRHIVGCGGVKAPPLDDGEVEIGYGIAPGWQGRGLGTEAARRLTDEALAHGARCVSAFTAPDNIASWHLLQRIGFRRDGALIDPDGSLLWRWVKESP